MAQPVNLALLKQEAVSIQQALQAYSQTIPKEPPDEQLLSFDKVHRGPALQFKQLHKKVEKIFAEQDSPDLQTRGLLLSSLSASDKLISKLTKEQESLLACWDLFQATMSALANDPLNHGSELSALLPRVAEVVNNNDGLNDGCYDAFASFERRLTALLIEVRFKQSLEENTEARERQGLVLDLAHFRIQFRKLQAMCDESKLLPLNKHIQNFDDMLDLYQKLKALNEILPEGLDPLEIEEMKSFIVIRENYMRRIVSAVYREAAMVVLYNEMETGDENTAQAAFSQMPDKGIFLIQLANVMKVGSLPTKTLNIPKLSDWPGTNDQKKAAIAKLLGDNFNRDPNAAFNKAEELRLRFEEETQLEFTVEPLILAFPRRPVETPPVVSQLLQSIQTLEVALEQLQDTKLPVAFRWLLAQQALAEFNIAEGPFFHLLHIHKKECPSLVKDEKNYGMKAFRGERGYSATDVQRIRAIERTMVECALAGLSEGIHADCEGNAEQFLSALEKTQLRNVDLPAEVDSVATTLYSAVYRMHKEERKANSALIDPDAPQFEGNFGKTAFLTEILGVNRDVRLKAIDEVRNQLLACWKIV